MREEVFFDHACVAHDPHVMHRYMAAIVRWQEDADLDMYMALQHGQSMRMHAGFRMLLIKTRCVAVTDLHVQRLPGGMMRALLAVGLHVEVISEGRPMEVAKAVEGIEILLDELEVGYA